MSPENLLDELRRAVSEAPDDMDLLLALVETLLDHGFTGEASLHLHQLIEQVPDDSSILGLAVRTFTASGDHLQAARMKRRLREAIARNEESREDSDEEEDYDWELGDETTHPSRDSSRRHLRLLNTNPEEAMALREPSHGLDDIAGLATVRRHLTEILDAISESDATAATGNSAEISTTSWTGGTLLYGPPSCGKAFLGEAIANELGALIWYVDIAMQRDAISFGQSLQKVTEVSGERLMVIYLDNLDADHDGEIVTQTGPLRTLDDVASRGVVVLGAATMPWQVNPDVLRTGRLGRVVLVLPPDAPARHTFVEERLSGRAGIDQENLEWIVRHTDGHSFGDLQRLIDVAIMITPTSTSGTVPVLDRNVIRKTRQRVGPSSADWLTTAGHHALMNEEAGLYDDLLRYFRSRERTK